MFDKELYYEVFKDGTVLISNLPANLKKEVDTAVAETKYILCPVVGKMKRQKKYPIDGGYLYLCSYDSSLTKNNFALCFDIFMALLPSYETAIKAAAQPAFDIVKALRHNVYEQLSHIQDDMKSLIEFDDIPYREWEDIVGYSSEAISSNADVASKSILRTIKRTATALSEFDAYDIINSTCQPSYASHQIHKVVKLSLQPYLFDFWDKNIKVNIGECFEKVIIDYELINLALNHFWSNAVKYSNPRSEINISFSPFNKSLNLTISMFSLAISDSELQIIFEKGTSGVQAKKAKLNGTGLGMYYIRECVNRSNCQFSINPGTNTKNVNGKLFANNIFRFTFSKP